MIAVLDKPRGLLIFIVRITSMVEILDVRQKKPRRTGRGQKGSGSRGKGVFVRCFGLMHGAPYWWFASVRDLE